MKALRALQDADVILHDRLVPAAVLDFARRDAARICVGKIGGRCEGTRQEHINELMIEHARQGRRVVRLKGGDPFIFGRGGEELEALARAGINFSVVPGITAATGCAAYAGIPLTHREHAHSVSFVTGHADQDGNEPDWRALALPGATAVFYMGLARLDHIVEKLLEHGAPADRPAALIAQGTTANQRVITATLATIRARVVRREAAIAGAAGGRRRGRSALHARLVRHRRGSELFRDRMSLRAGLIGTQRDSLLEAALRNPRRVEQARLILRAPVAQNGHDGMARAHLLRRASRRPQH